MTIIIVSEGEVVPEPVPVPLPGAKLRPEPAGMQEQPTAQVADRWQADQAGEAVPRASASDAWAGVVLPGGVDL